MLFFLCITSITFSLFGFIIGIWADNFDKLQLIQWGDASNHFITEKCMEPQEYKKDTREWHLKMAWDRYSK